MKSVVKWSGLALCAYVFFLVASLPASQVIYRLDLPEQLSIQGVSGTIWQGQASAVSYAGLPLRNVSWQLDILPLLWGSFSAEVKAGNIRQVDEIAFDGNLQVSSERLQLGEFQAYLPTDLILANLKLPFPVEAEGRFKLDIGQLDYATVCQSLSGKGQWLNAKVAGLNGLIDLGNFDATLGCENNNVVVNVQEPNSFG